MKHDFNPGPSSTTAAPYMPYFNSIEDPSGMAAPFISGGYTSLLIGVDQEAAGQLLLGSCILMEWKIIKICNCTLLLSWDLMK